VIFSFQIIKESEVEVALDLFKEAAEIIAKKKVDHWQYWSNPPQEKIDWLKEGIRSKEYFFIISESADLMGMVRIMPEDELYWGKQNEKAVYVHSLVIKEQYNGSGLGRKVLDKIASEASLRGIRYLRLDCDSKNPALCRYYENLGFKQVGTKKLPISIYNLYQRKIFNN
jgi:ribosomal protein S18 acetylase RimI-like enzyme